MSSATIGDAGLPNDDESYEGELGTGPLSLDTYRQKALEFQTLINAAGLAYSAVSDAYEITGDDSLMPLLAEFQEKAPTIRGIVESINLGAATLNSMGIRFPQLSYGQLGLAPFVLPAAIAAAFAAAGVWAGWLRGYVQASNDAIALVNSRPDLTPEQKAGLVASIEKSRDAVSTSKTNPFAVFADGLKWVSIAALVFMVYKMIPKEY